MAVMTHSHNEPPAPAPRSFWTSRAFLVFLGFAAIALVLMWEEHKAHILGVLPYLFLLACPLMHIFMHGGHGHGGQHDGRDPSSDSASSERDGGKS